MNRDAVDVLIVGAGPAGMRAAIETMGQGLRIVVVDEGPGPGGQVYRAAGTGPMSGEPALGADYDKGAILVAAFAASDAVKLFCAAVFLLERQDDGTFLVGVAMAGSAGRLFQARSVIIATGAHERPMPIPGWTLPGVMTAGAAQTLLKASGLVPEGRIVLAGMGPLLWLLAAQYSRLGVRIEALLDTTPRGNWRAALPHLPGFLFSQYAGKGLRLLSEVARKIPIYSTAHAMEALGQDRLDAVRFRAGQRDQLLPADVLLLHQGVVPQINLSMAIGARHVWNNRRRAFEPVLGEGGESSLPGLFIAGDTGGIGGAEVAELQGARAATEIIRRLIKIGSSRGAGGERGQDQLARASRGRAFLDVLYRPSDAQVTPADEVIVCRCEEVTAGDIRDAVRRGARGPNQAKAFTRAGMGPCQGRMCGLTVTAVIAAETGLSPQEVGYMRLRTPVKPVTVGQMASLAPASEDPA